MTRPRLQMHRWLTFGFYSKKKKLFCFYKTFDHVWPMKSILHFSDGRLPSRCGNGFALFKIWSLLSAYFWLGKVPGCASYTDSSRGDVLFFCPVRVIFLNFLQAIVLATSSWIAYKLIFGTPRFRFKGSLVLVTVGSLWFYCSPSFISSRMAIDIFAIS